MEALKSNKTERDIYNEGYLPFPSLDRYALKFRCYTIQRKLGYFDGYKDRPARFNEFGHDYEEFENVKAHTFTALSKGFSAQIKSNFDKTLSTTFVRLTSGYLVASLPRKKIEDVDEIYDEYLDVKDTFPKLRDMDILDFLLFYRDGYPMDYIKNRLDLYNNREDGLVDPIITDSILKNIILISGIESFDDDKFSKMQSDIKNVADVYLTAPLYIIAAASIYDKHPYSVVSHYMSSR